MQRKRSRRNGRVKTLSWRNDPSIRARLRLVEQVFTQPPGRALDLVNHQLELQEKKPISLDQLFTDKQHIREMMAERTPGGLEEHLFQFALRRAQTDRALAATPAGKDQTGLIMAGTRIEEDMAKLDGSWTRGGLQIEVGIEEGDFGRSPIELLDEGVIDMDDYQTSLKVLARISAPQSGGRRPVTIDAEAEVVDPQGPRGRELHRGAGGHNTPAFPPPPSLADAGDEEIPPIVDWDPDDQMAG